MGLQLTLPKEKNTLFYDFVNAYWALENVSYSADYLNFSLQVFPTREARLQNRMKIKSPSLGYGYAVGQVVDSLLYTWTERVPITDVFPSGSIPAGKDAQYTAIYTWIKAYTGLPFEDVLEEEEV